MKKAGFYILKDEFFTDMNDPYLKGNKSESRPHYYCFKDEKEELFWMIPLSSRVRKYRRIMENQAKKKKPCDILHIVKLADDRESVFLIQDMFPIIPKYIAREYTIGENHLVLTSEATQKIINKKARKVSHMLRAGMKFTSTQPDVNKIIEKLTEK